MYYTIRIKNKGVYLGYQCPVEGIQVSEFVIQILRAMGADVEIYDPNEVRKPTQRTKPEEKQPSKEDYEKALQQLMAEDVVVEEETPVKEEVEVVEETADEVLEEVVVKEKQSEEVVLDQKTHVYTDEEILNMTMAELKSVLLARGHTNALYDKLSPRTKDRRPDLIRKVKETQ